MADSVEAFTKQVIRTAERLGFGQGYPEYANAIEATERARFGLHANSEPMLPEDIAGAIDMHAMFAASPATVTE